MAPERVTVTIQSRAGQDAPLTVRDAMRQILDFFELLSDAGGEDSSVISWRLIDVSMRSPLSATAEAFSVIPGVPAEPIARKEKTLLAASFKDMTIGSIPQWMPTSTLHRAHEFFERNLNGIGRTDIKFYDDQAPIIIVERTARTAVQAIGQKEQALITARPDLSRSEFGSLEGFVTDTTTYYNRPAVNIRERLSGLPVQCVLSAELARRIGHQHDWAEVWEGRRVMVSGEIDYKRDGSIARVWATAIDPIDTNSLKYEDFKDPNFTNGLSSAEYLEKLWEGDGG